MINMSYSINLNMPYGSAEGQYAVLIIQNMPYCLEEQIRCLDCRDQYAVLSGKVDTSENRTLGYEVWALFGHTDIQSGSASTGYEDLEQIDDMTLEEIDLIVASGHDLNENEIFLQEDWRGMQGFLRTRGGAEEWTNREDSKALVTVDGEGVDWTNHSEDEDYALRAICNSPGLRYRGKFLFKLCVKVSYANLKKCRFVTAEGMHAVTPPMTGNYMPSGPDVEVDDSKFTYGPKQTHPNESETQSSEIDTYESNISAEPSELVSEPVVNEELHNKMVLLDEKNRFLIEAARTMLADSFLPNTFWAKAVSTALLYDKRRGSKRGRTSFMMNLKELIQARKRYALMRKAAKLSGEGVVADFTNLETVVNVSPIPTSRIHSTHPKALILGDPNSAVQTRSKVNKSSRAHAFVSYVQKQKRTNHKDFHHCLFACFLSQHEPKKISEALEDESWVDAMQEELLQFEIQKVWVLVDLPYGKKAIGTKWVYRNKKDERGVVVRNKARLVAQGHRQEEGIDYDELPEPGKSWWEFSVMEFEALMKSRFQMSSMGELTFFLGLQVKQKPDGIFISQDKYVAEILKKFDFANVKTASTPIETQKPLVKDEEANDVDVHLYRSMIGSLMYLTASRPDIMFAVCACSRFQVTPKTSHLSAVKRIFRYLKGKPKLGLWYPRVSSFDLESYSDSDYAGANLDRKSTTGGCQFLGRRLISWQCKKQTIVATSTTEAEYVAAASCCGQVLWIQNQMLDYGFNFMNTKIYIDNESTICIVLKIHTDDNVADLLTKAFDIRESLRGVNDGTEALLIPTLFILWLDKVSTASANLVPLGKVSTALERLKKNTDEALISLFTKILLSSTMAVLDSCPKHNMVAYLEKTEGNVEFHEIIDFLKRSSIHHALTVSPVVSTTFVEQFWTSAKSKTINNVRHITAKVAGKAVSISEASIRSDLLFDDADGIDTLPNQAIFDAIQQMGSKSTSWDQVPTNIATAVICLTSNQKYNFSKLIFDGKQLANVSVPLDHFPVHNLTSKVFSFMVKKGKHFSGKVTPLFATMLVQPTQDEGASSERPSEALPTPSPAPTSEVPYEPQTDSSPAHTSEVPIEHQPDPSPRPSPTTTVPDSIPETSGENLGSHSSSDKSLSGNEGDMTIQGVYDLCLSLCKQVSDQAKEIQALKAQITKLKKQAKPIVLDRIQIYTDEQVEEVLSSLKGDEEFGLGNFKKWEAERGEKQKLPEENAANEELIKDFDDIKARIEADRLLAEKLQEQTYKRLLAGQIKGTEDQTMEEIATQASQTSTQTPTSMIIWRLFFMPVQIATLLLNLGQAKAAS
ncbi:putative ribonuclease H-like domain-containing protein [Tanacetum coccineum]|uniref:Ribonuclease H-like domain-containing protein n=1 Tax=Tanacetum coccineum TaxID=301880 RepID=A0ABQ5GN87_9ASTR